MKFQLLNIIIMSVEGKTLHLYTNAFNLRICI